MDLPLSIPNMSSFVVYGIKVHYLREGPGPERVNALRGERGFLRDISPHLREFRKNHGKLQRTRSTKARPYFQPDTSRLQV